MSGDLQHGPLRIDISSLPTLARRVIKDMPGLTFEVHQSAHFGQVVVRVAESQRNHEVREQFHRLVQSL